ncbi:formyltetrahydrofolate deformylase [Nocardia sp. NPDC051911]|uniref:formyltetrahydrofolate deformylase n=1 Tax=Nocardia sp. NPDC051911 TaxID=3154648 RepID=UPI00343FD77E
MTTAQQVTDHVLTLSCPDQPGIVFAVSQFVFEHGLTIRESHQFGDRETGGFFMRVRFGADAGAESGGAELQRDFTAVANRFAMSWRLTGAEEKQRLLIMVSKYGHCLNDLLYRASTGWLDVEIVAVVSNHPDLEWLVSSYDIPFHHIPLLPGRKPEAEAELLRLVEDLDIDLVVLARYMQILSEDLCKNLEGRAINIHHSMLPSFKGARPYNQAHARGVKAVGATAHYVTSDLDEGPIIEQQVARVDHAMSARDVVELGRDTECLALAWAVRWHTENRILLDGHTTVVFR